MNKQVFKYYRNFVCAGPNSGKINFRVTNSFPSIEFHNTRKVVRMYHNHFVTLFTNSTIFSDL